MEKILKQSEDGKLLEVKWRGYEETTWQSRETLEEDVPDMVKAFDGRRRPGRPRKR